MSAAVADAVVGLVGATFGDDQEDTQSGWTSNKCDAVSDMITSAYILAGQLIIAYTKVHDTLAPRPLV